MSDIRGLLGIFVLLGIAFLFSLNRKKINWRLVIIGVALQVVFGLMITYLEPVKQAFRGISEAFVTFLSFAGDGAQFLFGSLMDTESFGFIFAFQVLPSVIFFSTVTAGLYYLGVLQKIVFAIAWVMNRAMGLSGAESLSAAGNIFLGQTEAPLLVRPFVKNMTKSELMCLMTGGMATIAGGVLAGYVAFLGGDDPETRVKFATLLLSASIMNAPAAIVMSKLLVPEEDPSSIDRKLKVNKDNLGANLIDALANGASEGLKLAANIAGMLLAFIALIFALNFGLEKLGDGFTLLWIIDIPAINPIINSATGGTFDALSMEYLFGQIFRVIAWVIGVDWSESLQVGSLIGQKTVINEFVAYLSLAEMKEAGLSPRSVVIATYALCGFSNFSSIAIQIGGIGGMAPNKQGELSKLGFRALLAATLACLMTAAIAGALFTGTYINN